MEDLVVAHLCMPNQGVLLKQRTSSCNGSSMVNVPAVSLASVIFGTIKVGKLTDIKTSDIHILYLPSTLFLIENTALGEQ